MQKKSERNELFFSLQMCSLFYVKLMRTRRDAIYFYDKSKMPNALQDVYNGGISTDFF